MPQASNSTFMLYTQAQAIQENEFTSSSKINMVVKFKTKHVTCVDLKWKGRHSMKDYFSFNSFNFYSRKLEINNPWF